MQIARAVLHRHTVTMNESILKALMRLFAIVSDINKEGQSASRRNIVMDYLDRQYSYEIVQKYIDFFDEQVKELRKISDNPEMADFSLQEDHMPKTGSSNSVTRSMKNWNTNRK